MSRKNPTILSKISNLAEEFHEAAIKENNIKLLQENEKLKETVTKLLAELDSIRGINRNPLIKNVSAEEEIVETQIIRLQALSRERTLTLDETRILDTLVKNKRLIMGQPTMNAQFETIEPTTSTTELLQLIESPNVQDETESSEENPME